MPKSYNIAIVGMGTIGELILSKLCEQVLQSSIEVNKITCISPNETKLESKLSDLKQSLLTKLLTHLSDQDKVLDLLDNITYTPNYTALNKADYIITAYSVPLDSSIKERADLLKRNDQLTELIAANIKFYAPKTCRIINIANPLDIMTMRLQQLTQLPADQVIGLSGLVDCTRLAQALHELLDIPYRDIDFSSLNVCGEHGPTMVPLLSQVKVNNKPLSLSPETIKKIEEFTQQKGTVMMKANHGIPPHIVTAEAVIQCLLAWTAKNEKVLCLSAWNDDYDCYLGCQVSISAQGIKPTNMLNLMSSQEKQKLTISADAIKKGLSILNVNQLEHENDKSTLKTTPLLFKS